MVRALKITQPKCWCSPGTSTMARRCWICLWWTWPGMCTRGGWHAVTTRSASRSNSCSRPLDSGTKRPRHAADDVLPVAGSLLTEQARGRIPRAVGAIQQPAPIGVVLEHDPDRLAQSAREVRDRRIDRHHEVQL